MHPICYNYKTSDYIKISHKKKIDKFRAVLKSIEELDPEYYIPSAGPACFLDDELFHLNFEEDGVFAKSWDFINFLNKYKNKTNTKLLNLNPGDDLNFNKRFF